MYDNLILKLNVDDVEGSNFEQTPLFFNATGKHKYTNSKDISITGDLDGLRITVNERRVTVSGSLCKWYLGNNFQTLTRNDTKNAIEKLSNSLHLPMDKATVSRIDVAQNFIVKHPTDVYLRHLGSLQYHTRLEEPNGIYYTNNKGKRVFYDKVKEQKIKGEKIPEFYLGKNVLRYEQRYISRLKDTFKVDSITAEMLYDEQFYSNIVNRWHEAYKAIKKTNDVSPNFKEMKTKKELYNIGVASLIKDQGGEIVMIESITEAYKKGELTKKQAHDLKQAIKEAGKSPIATVKSDVMLELDKKMSDAVEFCK